MSQEFLSQTSINMYLIRVESESYGNTYGLVSLHTEFSNNVLS